ncbi:MAG: hypothetical protein COW59_04480 [Lysobacterales bacterium CG17_big_fil_post_rev_8_21_14_2_50_64_11]|nr:MAG: hypothetical protein COW59_04480 [Xanthomonadales bacterium CG17_big_fil_post_rev_8_21_14_2_50_64_11]
MFGVYISLQWMGHAMEALMRFVLSKSLAFIMAVCAMAAAAVIFYPTPSHVFAAVEATDALQTSILCDKRVGVVDSNECRDALSILRCEALTGRFFAAADIMNGDQAWQVTKLAREQAGLLAETYGEVDCAGLRSASGDGQFVDVSMVEDR